LEVKAQKSILATAQGLCQRCVFSSFNKISHPIWQHRLASPFAADFRTMIEIYDCCIQCLSHSFIILQRLSYVTIRNSFWFCIKTSCFRVHSFLGFMKSKHRFLKWKLSWKTAREWIGIDKSFIPKTRNLFACFLGRNFAVCSEHCPCSRTGCMGDQGACARPASNRMLCLLKGSHRFFKVSGLKMEL
jgi:hypothetical protein